MADQNFYTNDPFGQVIGVLDHYRNQQRQMEDADLDRKIALLHDLITGPGANPARTAEGLKGILELQSAKGGRGKPKKGAAGFLGQNEDVMPHLLAQIIHGDIPMEGPTEMAVPKPQSPMEQGLMPKAAPIVPGAGLKDFTGETILNAPPIQVPPEPFNSNPTGDRMLGAARDMQKYNTGPKTMPLPQSQQPMRIAPDELAQREGRAAGIKTGATRTAQHESDVQYWKSIGMSDQEIAQMVKTQAMGAGTNLQTQDAGYFTVGGSTRHAIRILNPRTGLWDTVDELSGLPIPPDAAVTAAPSSAGQSDPTSLKEYNAVKSANDKSGLPTPSYDEWLTIDANRKKPVTNQSTALTAVDRLRDDFKGEPIVKRYNIVNDALQFVRTLNPNTQNPADDQGLIYAFAKAMDPDSVVREGEYATVQKYAQTWLDNFKFNAVRVLSNQEFLTPQARANMKATIETRAKPVAAQYENLYQSYLKMMTGRGGTATDLPNYSNAFPPVAAPGASPNIPSPPGAAAPPTAAPGNQIAPPVGSKIVTQAQVQQYATEHGIDAAAAAKVFTDKGYTVGGGSVPAPPAAVDVKKK